MRCSTPPSSPRGTGWSAASSLAVSPAKTVTPPVIAITTTSAAATIAALRALLLINPTSLAALAGRNA